MHARFAKSRGGTWVAAVLLWLVASTLNALELGGLSYATAPARPLSSITFSRSPVSFTAFALRVGGVAFTSEARGKDGLSVVAMRYVPNEPDGSRLKLTLRDKNGADHQVTASIYDWQLVPLVRFAESGSDAAVTLFGELEDKSLERREKRKDNMIANYNPAFQDTLLGLRLLQADMVVFEPSATDLFMDHGQYILGPGERAPSQDDLAQNRGHFDNLKAWKMRQGEQCQSYVTGDIGARIEYSYFGNRLELTGDPVWHCWREDTDAVDRLWDTYFAAGSTDMFILATFSRLEDETKRRAEQLYTDAKRQSAATGAAPPSPAKVVQQAEKETLKKFASLVVKRLNSPKRERSLLVPQETLRKVVAAPAEQQPVLLLEEISNNVERMEQANDAYLDKLMDEYQAAAAAVAQQAEKIPVIQMDEYSRLFSEQIKQEGGINPTIYAALQTSIRYAALFRHVAKANPQVLASLATSLSGVKPGVAQPRNFQLKTPTIYPRGAPVSTPPR